MTEGIIFYEGASPLDGKPIVGIALPDKKSGNRKTGRMASTLIIRSDIDPITASRLGEDYSICGDCIHRGVPNPNKESGGADERSCYVMLLYVLSVYKTYKKGKYTRVSGHTALANWFEGMTVRLGSYGDPSIIPSYIWDSILSKSKGRTGYTHQFGVDNADVRADMCMISVDNLEQAEYQWSLGNRTFRVGASVSEMIRGKEILCPASEEAGKRTTCVDCKLCSGNTIKAKNIFIPSHGSGKKHYNRKVA